VFLLCLTHVVYFLTETWVKQKKNKVTLKKQKHGSSKTNTRLHLKNKEHDSSKAKTRLQLKNKQHGSSKTNMVTLKKQRT
jgi:hypothetical protein